MTDPRLIWSNQYGGFADLVLQSDGSLEADEDLATAVIVSLFSDRLADASDKLPPGSDDRRGWWGDTDLQRLNPGDLLGSRLWLLDRHTSDAKLPLVAKGYILEALQWLLDDGVAASVDVECFFLQPFDQSKLGAIITITRYGTRPVSLKFDWAWRELGVSSIPSVVTASLLTADGGSLLTADDGTTVLTGP